MQPKIPSIISYSEFDFDITSLDQFDLKNIIKKGENQFLEFKTKVKYPEKIVKELVAFANSQGGILFLGVTDDGQINGLPYPEDDYFDMERAIEKYVFPAFSYSVKVIPLDNGKSILVYKVSPSLEKPHFVQITQEESPICYVRVEDKSIQASKELKTILRREQEEGVKFTYGEHERILVDFLHQNEKITLKEFQNLVKIPEWLASRKLILLVLTNVLKIVPSEMEDIYFLR
ncbi:MAG: hypothetical protein RIR51_2056 [Bacteroidota bacterium]|jgi:predicted HTH transcriptional regulator